MQFNVGFATDIGRKRQQNQDNGLSAPEVGLFVVADGMGGHRGGETASAMAVEVIPQKVKSGLKKMPLNPRAILEEAISAANAAIYDRALKQPGLQGMGTTTVAMLFNGKTMTIGHVGDSRCYFLRPGSIWQLSRDHSLVQEKLRAGLITREQLKTDRMKNVITRSVGFEPEVSVETYEIAVQPGDTFLICSDGLSGMIDDLKMLELVEQGLYKEGDAQKTVQRLIESANAAGGDDNVTTIVVQVVATD